MTNPFETARYRMRPELPPVLGSTVADLGTCGDWLTGAQRRAVAAEARHAWNCAICRERKAALSPAMVTGEHDSLGELPAAWVDVVHRVVTDSGRLTETWLHDRLADGIVEDEYVEIVSVAIIMTVVDAFALGVGVSPPDLPDAQPGTPRRERRPDAKPGPGWVSTIAPEDALPDFADYYAGESFFYIRRSLTLVPGEVYRFWPVMNELYMSDPRVHELEGLERGINRAQIEFLAARASMLLGCYY